MHLDQGIDKFDVLGLHCLDDRRKPLGSGLCMSDKSTDLDYCMLPNESDSG